MQWDSLGNMGFLWGMNDNFLWGMGHKEMVCGVSFVGFYILHAYVKNIQYLFCINDLFSFRK